MLSYIWHLLLLLSKGNYSFLTLIFLLFTGIRLTGNVYRETGVCRGIPIFLIFVPKHRLWVIVRTNGNIPSTGDTINDNISR